MKSLVNSEAGGLSMPTEQAEKPASLFNSQWKAAPSIEGDFFAVYPDTNRPEFPVCVKPEFMREDVWRKVARFIAAAPQMADALEGALTYIARFEDMQDGDYGAPEPNEAMQISHNLRQVIALARAAS